MDRHPSATQNQAMVPTATCPVVASDGNETPDDRPLANLRFEPMFARGTRALRPTFPLKTWAVAFAISLGYWISRNPSDLLAHMQRVHLHHRLGQGEATYGAMLDQFVALRGGGAALRQRTLYQVANILRARAGITFWSWASRRPAGKARGGRIVDYLTDEQRSQTGWIGVQDREVISKRALSPAQRDALEKYHAHGTRP